MKQCVKQQKNYEGVLSYFQLIRHKKSIQGNMVPAETYGRLKRGSIPCPVGIELRELTLDHAATTTHGVVELTTDV